MLRFQMDFSKDKNLGKEDQEGTLQEDCKEYIIKNHVGSRKIVQ